MTRSSYILKMIKIGFSKKNKIELEETFTSFEDGERFLKRNYEAALVRDDLFVDYLMSEVKKREDA